MNLSTRIREARKLAGMTQIQLAKAAGVVQQTIQKLESGELKASRHVIAIAKALEVEPEWLVNGESALRAAVNASRVNTRPQKDELVHDRNVPGSRFRRLNEEMLRKAELYAITAEATEGVTYAPVVFNRYLLDAYEIIEANNGDFPVKDHDQWVSDALARRQQRGTTDGRRSDPGRQTTPRGKPHRG